MTLLIDRASFAPHIVASAVFALECLCERKQESKTMKERAGGRRLQHAATRCNMLQHEREPQPEAAVSLRKMATFVTWSSSRTEFLV